MLFYQLSVKVDAHKFVGLLDSDNQFIGFPVASTPLETFLNDRSAEKRSFSLTMKVPDCGVDQWSVYDLNRTG